MSRRIRKQDTNWSSAGLAFIRLCARSPVYMQDFYAHHLAMSYSNQDGIFNNISHREKSKNKNRFKDKNALLVFKLLLQKNKGPSLLFLNNAAEKPVSRETQLDSIGLIAIKVLCKNIYTLRKSLFQRGYEVSRIAKTPSNELSFFLRDPECNYLYFHEDRESANRNKKHQRTDIKKISGCVVGVKKLDTTCEFYKLFTACDTVLFDRKGQFSDLEFIASEHKVRRAKLIQTQKSDGIFSQYLFGSEIDLVETQNPASHYREQDASMYQIKRGMLGSIIHNLEAFIQYGIKENIFIEKPKLQDFYHDGTHIRYAFIKDPGENSVICIEVLAHKSVSKETFTTAYSHKKALDAKPIIQSLFQTLR